jgi:hypothetical protein
MPKKIDSPKFGESKGKNDCKGKPDHMKRHAAYNVELENISCPIMLTKQRTIDFILFGTRW